MQTDSDNSSTIIDLDTGRYLILDHDNRMYSVMNFADMADMAEQMAAQSEEMLEEARAEARNADNGRSLEEANAENGYDVKGTRTGKTRCILWHRAEHGVPT